MKHHSLVVDFSNLDFEKIDTKILVDEAKNKRKLKLTLLEGRTLLLLTETKEMKLLCPPLNIYIYIYISFFLSFWRIMAASLFWGL